jgi:outer membrane receptor protein involved in Fe transport
MSDYMTKAVRRPGRAAAVAALGATFVAAVLAPGFAHADTMSGTLEEIVVTAEKRVSTVQSTPISITAVSGEQLAAQGIATVEDLAATTPGISMRTAGPGQTEFEMRGLSSSGGSAPTVGFYLDEVPLSPAAASLNGRVVIDPDLYDLRRVEVLRGPQGTLYGSGSMGGTIKLVTNPPALGKFDTSEEVSVSNTQGGGTNPGASAMVNLPMGETVALRLVGTYKYTDGFIDRIVEPTLAFPSGTCPGWAGQGCVRGDVTATPVSKVVPRANATTLESGRASLLWKPTSELSFTTTAMYQGMRADGYNQYQVPPGADVALALYSPADLKEPVSDTFKMLSEVITYDFTAMQLTSATSFWKRNADQSQDSTEALQNLFVLPAYYPVLYTENDESQQFSQELRLTSTSDGDLQWVGGLFYSDLKSTFVTINQDPAYAQFSVGGAAANPQGLIYNADNPYHLKQSAVFGDVTYKLTSQFKITGGLRWYRYSTDETFSQAGLGTQSGNATATTGAEASDARGFNPKVTLSYMPSGELTLYTTAARGFRPGGISLPVPTTGGTACPAVPLTYNSDKVMNYEAGEKARLLDGKLVVNADVYYIKWSDLQQIIELGCGYPYTANAGNARSYGPELEVSAKLTPEFTVNLSATYTNAVINDPANVVGGSITAGTPVLNIPKETASLMLVYDQQVSATMDSVTRLTDSYVGSTADIAFLPQTLPSHNLLDFRTGLLFGHWATYLFADNLTNKHAALTINNTSFAWQTPSITRVTTNLPRTIGLDVQYHY